MDLLGQALKIAREVGDRYDEANELNYLGWAQLALRDARQAAILLEPCVPQLIGCSGVHQSKIRRSAACG